jgi:SagB-type dehydrogenase family enzyme
MTSQLAAIHKRLAAIPPFSADPREWPASWKTVEFKEYPRFRSFVLPPASVSDVPYGQVMAQRFTTRAFKPAEAVDIQSLSNVLHYGAGISRTGADKRYSSRFYPSGGARYPLELYLSFAGNSKIPRGVYHYNVAKHALERLLGAEGDTSIRALPSYPWVKDAAAIGMISVVLDRTTRKYGARGYRFALMEAGIFTHSLHLACTAEGLGCSAIGTNNDAQIERILDLDGESEFYVGQFVFGMAAGPAHDARTAPL